MLCTDKPGILRSFNMRVSSDLSSSVSKLSFTALVSQVPEPTQNFCQECGIVEAPKTVSADLQFQTGCESETCKSDLKLDVFMKDYETEPYFVIGSSKKLTIAVLVENIYGEPAYAPSVEIVYPPKLKLSQIVSGCEGRESQNRLTCRLPGPIFMNQGVKRYTNEIII